MTYVRRHYCIEDKNIVFNKKLSIKQLLIVAVVANSSLFLLKFEQKFGQR